MGVWTISDRECVIRHVSSSIIIIVNYAVYIHLFLILFLVFTEPADGTTEF